jgi:hypothetical protein
MTYPVQSAPLSPALRAAIEAMLATDEIARVVIRVAKKFKVRVSHADVTAIYAEIATTRLGRSRATNTGRRAMPIPADFADHAPLKTNKELKVRYRVDDEVIARWRAETGIASPANARKLKPMPDDFVALGPTMTKKAAADRYGVSCELVRRWYRDAGISSLDIDAATRMRALNRRRRLGSNAADRAMGTVVVMDAREASVAGMAARHLQKFAPTYRCDRIGRADPHGKFWRFGRAVTDDAGIIERAEYRGYDAEAWRRIPA